MCRVVELRGSQAIDQPTSSLDEKAVGSLLGLNALVLKAILCPVKAEPKKKGATIGPLLR